MEPDEITLADMLAQTEGTSQGAGIRFLYAQNHEARLEAVQDAVDFACNRLEQKKHIYQGLNENAVTAHICDMLDSGGIPAKPEQSVGGHCDVVVSGNHGFLWLAEAKKHNDYEWLNQGFHQISSRYSTCVVGQDHADLLIYCYSQNALAMLSSWRNALSEKNPRVVTANSPCGNPLIFCSEHEHDSSGLKLHVRHKAIALYWNPQTH